MAYTKTAKTAKTAKTFKKPAAETVSVEEKITNLFVEGLKQGIVAWQKPWVNAILGNVVSGTNYSGGNKFWGALHAAMYNVRPFYATVAGAMAKLGYKRAENGYTDSKGNAVPFPIKAGAKGLHITYYEPKTTDAKDANGQPILDSAGNTLKSKFFILKSFVVFSIDHLDWDLSKFVPQMKDNQNLDSGESIVAGYKNCPKIQHGGNEACYFPTADFVQMPEIGQFKSSEDYYRTLFHELVHSTGHKAKLKRAGFDAYCTRHEYSFEELVAEIGAGMLCELSGIPMDTENSITYLNHWISKLQSEPKWIMKAVSQAKKAVEMILGRSIDPKAEAEVAEELEA